MSNRFHNKFHRVNHHSFNNPQYVDAGLDPIASKESPFSGEFIMDNESNENWPLSSKWIDTAVVKPGYDAEELTLSGDVHVTEDLKVDGGIEASALSAEEINADRANIEYAAIGEADIEKLASEVAVINTLSALNATIVNLSAIEETVIDLSAKNVIFESMTGDDATISSGVFSDLTVNNETVNNSRINTASIINASVSSISGYNASFADAALGNVSFENMSGKFISVNEIDAGSGYYDFIGSDSVVANQLESNLVVSKVLSGEFGRFDTISGEDYFVSDKTLENYIKGFIPDISGKYLPISGGTVSGSLDIMRDLSVSGNQSVNGKLDVDGRVRIHSSLGVGEGCVAAGSNSVAMGINAKANRFDGQNSFVWNGVDDGETYFSNASGTFNINPESGASGFYIGEQSLAEIIGSVDHSYLPLSGGEVTGNVSIFGKFVQGPNGESDRNYADGECAHAEGHNTNAIGAFSHTEGFQTSAHGSASHAEGTMTQANGPYVHAEGNNTLAFGDASHAEGRNSKTNGKYSHAEGFGGTTDNTADYSHVDGIKARATGKGTYVWQGLLVDNEYSQTEYRDHGNGTFNINPSGGISGFYIGDTPLSDIIGSTYTAGNGIEISEENNNEISVKIGNGLVFSDDGKVEIETECLPLTGGTVNGKVKIDGFFENGFGCSSIGENSHAEGRFTIASGDFSHAEGESTRTRSPASHTEGLSTTTYGFYSHAEGESTRTYSQASHSEGHYTETHGVFSHAEGEATITSGYASHAEGSNTKAFGTYSHSEGIGNYSYGAGSHAEGYHTSAMADASHVVGRYAEAVSADSYSYVYNGKEQTYQSHGVGTFNINPVEGIDGFYIGEQTLSQIISGSIPTGEYIPTSGGVCNGSIQFIGGGPVVIGEDTAIYLDDRIHRNLYEGEEVVPDGRTLYFPPVSGVLLVDSDKDEIEEQLAELNHELSETKLKLDAVEEKIAAAKAAAIDIPLVSELDNTKVIYERLNAVIGILKTL